jgi:hypothetical protein
MVHLSDVAVPTCPVRCVPRTASFCHLTIFLCGDVNVSSAATGHLDLVNHPTGRATADARKSLSHYYYTPTIDDEPLISPTIHESHSTCLVTSSRARATAGERMCRGRSSGDV